MTIGIYKLNFKGTDKVYIGQSVNSVTARYKQHLSTLTRGDGSPKLQEAYNLYGLPSLELIEECNPSSINAREIYYIDRYDSLFNGFNATIGGTLPSEGTNNGNSVYSKINLLKSFRLLKNPKLTYEQIYSITGVAVPVIGRIARGSLHNWMHTKYPIASKIIKNNLDLRYKYTCRPSLEGTGYVVKSPEGILYTIDIVSDFCKEHSLTKGNFMPVLREQRRTHRGWTLHSKA